MLNEPLLYRRVVDIIRVKGSCMAKVVSITTKKGDSGFSYLANGKKFPKDHLVFEVLGSLDELNAHLGYSVAQLRDLKGLLFEAEIQHLEEVQENLYTLSAVLAGAKKVVFDTKELKKIESHGNYLQEQMSEGWTTQFVYPGGSVPGAALDVARTVCRRTERITVEYLRQQESETDEAQKVLDESPEIVFQYVNRLSDFLFIVRCYVNSQLGITEKKFSQK